MHHVVVHTGLFDCIGSDGIPKPHDVWYAVFVCTRLSDTSSNMNHVPQVITEAIMSLHHEESDRVFPTLYLPIMEECHKRVFARWREFNPFSRAWWRHRSRTRRLDSYICGLIAQRWSELAARKQCASAPAANI